VIVWRGSRGIGVWFVRTGRFTRFYRSCSLARRRRTVETHRKAPAQFPGFVPRTACLEIGMLTRGTLEGRATCVGHAVLCSARNIHFVICHVVLDSKYKSAVQQSWVVSSLFEGQDPCYWALLRTSFGKSFLLLLWLCNAKSLQVTTTECYTTSVTRRRNLFSQKQQSREVT
jgi:hypothetical protein